MATESIDTASGGARRWYERIGPGIITACVVIGPGSILTSSKTGAAHGYSLAWVVAAAVVFMLVFMTLGAKLGVIAGTSPGDLIRARGGRPLAILIGVGIFMISAGFQFGNNLGVHSAFAALGLEWDYTAVAFNAVSILFLFGFKNLYRAVERLMMGLVGLMLLSFVINLIFAKPHLGELAAGFLPGRTKIDITLLGLVGTTFVVSAGYFQAFLVQQKGWGKPELRSGLLDARVGSVIMALITLMLMWTAAAGLRNESLNNVEEVAQGLNPLFGGWGQPIFCLGLFSAAYSSFLVNSMIGGFILSDGLGLGSKPTDRWPRLFTVFVLLTGMFIALYAIKSGTRPVAAIVTAQALTVIASPLAAGALLWLTNRRDVMGEERNGPLLNILGGLGFLILLAMAWRTAAYNVWPAIAAWLEG